MTDYPRSVLGTTARSAADIAAELRREFATAMVERFGTQPRQDPVLATLFHALAVQLARVYDEAEQVFPEAVFDDLVSGLGMPARTAQPAQVVVQFSEIHTRELLVPETLLVGYNRAGETIPFVPDVPVQLAPTELAFFGVVEGGRLHALSGARLPNGGAPIPPASAVLPDWRMSPTMFFALDAPEHDASGLGIFIESQSTDDAAAGALRRSPWQLLDAQATVTQRGILRPRSGPGGVQLLRWSDDAGVEDGSPSTRNVFSLGEGIFGPHVWVFPEVPPELRVGSLPPHALAPMLEHCLPASHQRALLRPLVWVQIPLPAGTQGVASAVQRAYVNCVSASNLEALAERVTFDRLGTVVNFQPEGSRDRQVVAVLGVTGEQGQPYADESDPALPVAHGRYGARAGRLELRPARGKIGRFDRFAMARLLFCDGARANELQPGDLRRIGAPLANVTAQVCNLTTSRGGSPPPAYGSARLRFAELLRTHDRIVTTADVEASARAFEPRILATQTESRLTVRPDGLPQRVDHVTVSVRASDFVDPEAELVRLRELLERHLQHRVTLGQHVRVAVRSA